MEGVDPGYRGSSHSSAYILQLAIHIAVGFSASICCPMAITMFIIMLDRMTDAPVLPFTTSKISAS